MAKRKKDELLAETDVIEFVPADEIGSSGESLSAAAAEQVTAPTPAPIKLEDMSPVYRELALPKLPELSKENRARLQMQTPNRLFFYWSVGANPFNRLNKALGTQTAGYTLVLKLVDLKTDVEWVHAVEGEGSWWFDVEADSRYRAEIGFYAPSRPYIRVLFSNTVETPRKSPSPRVDTEEDWQVSATGFARVLEVAGFTEDAFDIALAGDDVESADAATRSALSDLIGERTVDLASIAADEIRYALLLLASGSSLESLRGRISPALFAILERYSASLSSENALNALAEHFDIDADEIVEEEFDPAVFGASSIHFPRRLRTRRTLPKLQPLSSRAKAF